MQAVRLAVARGAQVVAVNTDPVARQRCLDAGALAALDPASPGTVEQVLDAAQRPDGLDGVVDCVGIGKTFTTALRMLRVNGHCAVVGIEPLMLTTPAHFMRRALRVSGIYGYTAADIAEVAAKVADGSLDLRASISAVMPLDEVTKASGCSRIDSTPRCESSWSPDLPAPPGPRRQSIRPNRASASRAAATSAQLPRRSCPTRAACRSGAGAHLSWAHTPSWPVTISTTPNGARR